MGVLFLDKSFLLIFLLDAVVVLVVVVSTVVDTSGSTLFIHFLKGTGVVDNVIHITGKRVNLETVLEDVNTRLDFSDISVLLLDELLIFVSFLLNLTKNKVSSDLLLFRNSVNSVLEFLGRLRFDKRDFHLLAVV